MIYGKNFLPTIPGRWTLSNSIMNEGKMTINVGGWTAAFIEEDDISLIPASLRLTIIANTYTDAYTPTNFVDISIITDNESHINIMCPIVDTGNGIYTADLELYETKFEEFRITIRSVYGMEVTSWSLAAPIGGDNTEIINELRGELPRLLYDYNKMPITITQPERTIALISAWLVKDTDLNGHIQLTYTATHNTRLHIRCKGNDISELFTPVIYDIKPGRGSIGIPHAYLQKKVGYHTFTVSAQVEEGTITFATRAIIYTIDGGHLASRVQDVGIDVRDIALRRTAEEREPSWIYAIGIDDGEAIVKARPHSDIASIAWEPKLTIGPAEVVSIAFDGVWNNYNNTIRYETEDEPWLFWVTGTTLYAQHFDNIDTKITLATDVLAVATIRGWGLSSYYQHNQGLIVAYVTNTGLVKYRSYTSITAVSKGWQMEELVAEYTQPAKHLNLFRTNDYRLGLNIIGVDNSVTTLITDRIWSGLAYGPDNVNIGLNASTSFDCYEVETTKHKVPDERIDLDILTGSVFNLLELPSGPMYAAVKAVDGAILSKRSFYIDFNCPVRLWLKQPDDMISNVLILDAVITDTKVLFNTAEDLLDIGFTAIVTPGALLGKLNNNYQEIYEGANVKIRGNIPPTQETIELSVVGDTSFDVYEPVRSTHASPDETVTLSLQATTLLAIYEASTNPI